MQIIKVKKRKYIIIAVFVFTSILLGTGLSRANAISGITSQPWTGSPLPSAVLYTHRDNSLTTFRDNGLCGPTNDPSSALNIVTRIPGDPIDYSVVNESNGWKVVTCPHLRAVGHDETVYFVQRNASDSKRLVAMRKNTVLWTSLLPNGACNYTPQLFDLKIGYDGNLYVNVMHQNCGSPDLLKFTSFSANNGSIRFQTALPSGQSSINTGMTASEILPYNNGIAVVNNKANVYYFGYSGVMDSSKTFTPNVPTNSSILSTAVNESGRVYLVVSAVTARRIFYKDISSTTIQELTPSIGSEYVSNIYSAPNNKVVLRWYKNYERGISYLDSNGSDLFTQNLQYDGNYTLASAAQPWVAVDSLGNAIVIRTMTYGSQRLVFVDSFDTAGAKTRLMDSDSEFGLGTTDRFATGNFSSESIGNEIINLLLCHTTGSSANTACPSSENPKIVTIPIAAAYDYPRSSLFSALNGDSDGDGLMVSEEAAQGTLDTMIDTDLDGLSDYTESTKLTNRDYLFCNSSTFYCEYPSPTQKDIYIETDWMYKPTTSGYSSNAYSMQLTTNQINLIKAAYSNKGVIAHIDNGQLGGGNEVPYQQAVNISTTLIAPDFYNYKYGGDGLDQHFDQDRYHTYHYLLLGYEYGENPGSSGAAFAGDDDTFISYGLIKDAFTYSSFDTAIASTIVHEIGHTLCLTGGTSPAYPSQPANCRFSGIDAYAGNDYPSAMNYSKQLYLVDYSSGGSSSNDHDDWSALRFQDFALQDVGDPMPGVNNFNAKKIKKVKSKLIIGPTNYQLVEARKKVK